MRFGVNAAKLDFAQRRGRGIFVETKIKMFLLREERHIPAE
jgi:hypothetical protein